MIRLFSFAFGLMSATATFACEIVTVDEIEIENAWARASIGTARPGVVYLTIRNMGRMDDVLVAITTPAADMPMLHETVVSNGVASMPHVMSVPLPAGARIVLEPGSFHAMLMGLTAPLLEGGTFPLTLMFQNAGAATVNVDIRAMTATGSGC